MRTPDELMNAREPRVHIEKAEYAYGDMTGRSVSIGDPVPVSDPGETYEQQILEVLLDIRSLLAPKE